MNSLMQKQSSFCFFGCLFRKKLVSLERHTWGKEEIDLSSFFRQEVYAAENPSPKRCASAAGFCKEFSEEVYLRGNGYVI